jgi:Icc-related predicted phosphoesterase
MRITVISDTHTKHHQLTNDLIGGDLIIHAGDISSMGYFEEIKDFCNWYESLNQYDNSVFIAGNHDWGFQDNKVQINSLIDSYEWITYLEDSKLTFVNKEATEMCSIWGTPWQPEFHNWAFNLPRNGWELQEKWMRIPSDIDILVTHGPPFGILDVSSYGNVNAGCELLLEAVKVKKPKIHIFGHIHSGFGYQYVDGTHYINASMLDERYNYSRKPLTFDWNPQTNELEFV